jgi:hypothetical protein
VTVHWSGKLTANIFSGEIQNRPTVTAGVCPLHFLDRPMGVTARQIENGIQNVSSITARSQSSRAFFSQIASTRGGPVAILDF